MFHKIACLPAVHKKKVKMYIAWGPCRLEFHQNKIPRSCPDVSLQAKTYVMFFQIRKEMTMSSAFVQTIVLNVGL